MLTIKLFKSPTCVYCGAVEEFLRKMEKRYAGIQLEVIDITRNPSAISDYEIKALPTVIFDRNRFVGKPDFAELTSAIQDAIGKERTSGFIKEKKSIKQVINEIRSIDGVIGCLVLGDTGFIIASNLDTQDPAVVGAMVFTAYSSASGAFSLMNDELSYQLFRGLDVAFTLWRARNRLIVVVYRSSMPRQNLATISAIIGQYAGDTA